MAAAESETPSQSVAPHQESQEAPQSWSVVSTVEVTRYTYRRWGSHIEGCGRDMGRRSISESWTAICKGAIFRVGLKLYRGHGEADFFTSSTFISHRCINSSEEWPAQQPQLALYDAAVSEEEGVI